MNGSTGTGAGSSAPNRSDGQPRTWIGSTQGFNKVPRGSQDTAVSHVGGNPILNWYIDKDGPWDGVVNSRSQAPFMPSRNVQGLQAFSQYRNTNVPSECSTIPPSIPTDSGYVSGHRHSVGNPSVYSDVDRATDTQSIVGHMHDLFSSNVSNFSADQSHHRNGWSHPEPQLMSNTQPPEAGANATERVCRVCNATCKTRSDMKKHEARHSKPHRCREPGCTRTVGFSTLNDLARHIRSRHPATKAQGNRYKCHLGTCANTNKLWPRADNFRQHLTRKHKPAIPIDNLEPFIYQGPDQIAESGDSGRLGLRMSNVGADPATIQSLTSRAMGSDVADLAETDDHHQGDDRMVDVEGNFSEEVSLVGRQFSDVPPSANDRGQDDLHHQTNDQIMYSRPGELNLGRTMDQPVLNGEHEILDLHLPGGSVQGKAAHSVDQPGPRNQMEPFITVDPPRSESPSPALETDFEPGGSEDHDEDRQSEGDTPDDEDDMDAPGEDDADANAKPESHAAAQGPWGQGHETPSINKTDTTQTAQPEFPTATHRVVQSDEEARTEDLRKLLKSFKETGKTDTLQRVLLEEVGFEQARPSLPAKLKRFSSPQGVANGTSMIRCPEPGCQSEFWRECELRKHSKRHIRPYGCTFRSCPRKFGSKSDWKRHENSQHHQMDVWKCDEKAKDPLVDEQVCGKVCHRRETFKLHLQKDHGIGLSPSGDGSARVALKLESRRFGKNCEAGFWCGFCLSVVETVAGKDGPGGWTERYDHIDDHISGRSGPARNMDDWRHDGHDVVPSNPVASTSASGLSPSSGSDGSARNHASSSSSPYSENPGDKRRPRLDGGEHPRRQKRTRVERTPGLWYCCACGLFNNPVLTEHCMGADGCKHHRCDACQSDDTLRHDLVNGHGQSK